MSTTITNPTAQQTKIAILLAYAFGQDKTTVKAKNAADIETFVKEKPNNFLPFVFLAKDLACLFHDARNGKTVEGDIKAALTEYFKTPSNNKPTVNFLKALCGKITSGSDKFGTIFIGLLSESSAKWKALILGNTESKPCTRMFADTLGDADTKFEYLDKVLAWLDDASVTVPAGLGSIGGGSLFDKFANQSGGTKTIQDLFAEIAGLNVLFHSVFNGMVVNGVVVNSIHDDTVAIVQHTPTAPVNKGNITLAHKYKIVIDGHKVVLKDMNDKDVPNTLIQLDNKHTLDTLGVKPASNDAGKIAIIQACNRSNGNETECLKILAGNILGDDNIVEDNSFNNVNPKLIIELLETLRWPWNMTTDSQKNVTRSYAPTFASYVEYRKQHGVTVDTTAVNDFTKKYLEKCVNYINTQYKSLLNDALLFTNNQKSTNSYSGLKLSYPVTGMGTNEELIQNVQKMGLIPAIVSRNNSIASFAKLPYVPGQILFSRGGYDAQHLEQNGGTMTTAQLYNFYNTSIERLTQALKVANKSLDAASESKIRNSLEQFRQSHEEFDKMFATMRKYNIHNSMAKDSKQNVTIEDMDRFNSFFDSSLNNLNRSEIKLSKIIAKLQEEMLNAFKKQLNDTENKLA